MVIYYIYSFKLVFDNYYSASKEVNLYKTVLIDAIVIAVARIVHFVMDTYFVYY